jgi:hypothetical protein
MLLVMTNEKTILMAVECSIELDGSLKVGKTSDRKEWFTGSKLISS